MGGDPRKHWEEKGKLNKGAARAGRDDGNEQVIATGSWGLNQPGRHLEGSWRGGLRAPPAGS